MKLNDLIQALLKQNERVGIVRNDYLGKEAERKTFEARLIQAASGKSHAEKTVNAQATDEWLNFHKSLARAESVYEFERFKLEILDKEWLAEYQQMKDDDRQIKRGAS